MILTLIKKLLFATAMVLIWSLLIWLGGCIWHWQLFSFKEFYNFSTWGSVGRMVFFIWMTVVVLIGLEQDV
jgi:phosphate starvation-inducible membrane PsiE